MDKHHILVVDDEPTTLAILKFILGNAGYAVTTAQNGEDAIDLVNRFPYSLMILDISMPGLSGLQVLEVIRKIPKLKDLPVFMLTGKSDIELVKKAKSLDARFYIMKPPKKNDLLKKISLEIGSSSSAVNYDFSISEKYSEAEIGERSKIFSLSEVGLEFSATKRYSVGEKVDTYEIPLFRELELKRCPLVVCSCEIDPPEILERYIVGASFIEFPKEDLEKIRNWILVKIQQG